MIKACDALVALKLILTLITQQRCHSLRSHGLFKYSTFSAPGDIIDNFTTFGGDP